MSAVREAVATQVATGSAAVALARRTRAAQGLDPDRITDPTALAAIAAVLRGGDRRGT